MFPAQNSVTTIPIYLEIKIRLITTESYTFKLRRGGMEILNNIVI